MRLIRVIYFFSFIFLLWTQVSLAQAPSYLRQNLPKQDHSDFFGYNPKHSVNLERNPWGFHEFWWYGPEEKGPYTLQVAKDKEFKDLIYFQTVNRYYDFTRHLPDQAKVYWRVKYKDRVTPAYEVNLIPGRKFNITLNKAEVKKFDLSNRKKGAIVLSWNEKQGRGPYDVEVSPDADFSSLVFRKRVRKQEYKIEEFAEAGQFYWRVKLGKFVSPVGRFRINQAMVNSALQMQGPYIKLQAPSSGGLVDIEDSEVEFTWQGLGFETKYQIEVARTGEFSDIVFSKELAETDLKIPNFKEQGTYFWRVTSPRYESPVNSFVVAPSRNIFQQSFSLFRQIFLVANKKTYFVSADYQLSALQGSDLDNSTAGKLVADSYLVFNLGMEKQLYPTWTFETSFDFSMVERSPPAGFVIENPVESLFGVQAGVQNKVLKDFKAGLFLRYSEFEVLQTVTGSFFAMDKASGFSVGGNGEYNILKWSRLKSHVGAQFYSVLPIISDVESALSSKFFWDFRFKISNSIGCTASIFYQNIGLIREDSAQSSNNSGLNLKFSF